MYQDFWYTPANHTIQIRIRDLLPWLFNGSTEAELAIS